MAILEPHQRRPGAWDQHDLALGRRTLNGLDGAIPFPRCTSSSAESAEVIALFRYRIIGEATSSRLSPAERGRIVRELARRVYEHPDGSQRQYTRGTLDRWIRAYREQGLSGLKPEPRSDAGHRAAPSGVAR